MHLLGGRSLSLVLMIASTLLVAFGSAAPSPGSGDADPSPSAWDMSLACQTSETAPAGVPALEDIDPTLWELHALFRGLPGFVDVYYYQGQAPAFRPMFIGEVPAAAREVQTDLEIGFDVLPVAPMELGPGLVPDAGDLQCTGIRPGSRVSTPVGICTTNFVFTSGGNTYIGTAGHCGNVGQTATVSGVGIVGTISFSTGSGGVGNDFALIKIDASKVALVNPEMCDFAGPTGVWGGGGITGRRVLHTGHGAGLVAAPPRPKEGVGWGIGATSVTWIGGGIPGDSGSPARIDSGQALAVVTHLGIVPPGFNFGTRIDVAMGWTGVGLSTVAYTHVG